MIKHWIETKGDKVDVTKLKLKKTSIYLNSVEYIYYADDNGLAYNKNKEYVGRVFLGDCYFSIRKD